MAFQNIYRHRKVADTSSKACEICYKPSSSVLVAPENKDFFYVCPAHLKDKGFCSPIINEAAIAAKKKREWNEEVARLKKEFEEKKKKKQEEEKEKNKDEEKDKIDGSKKEEDGKSSEFKNKEADTDPVVEEEPRVFALQRSFYQQRLDKKRNTEIARRNRDRLQNPSLFPVVPKGLPVSSYHNSMKGVVQPSQPPTPAHSKGKIITANSQPTMFSVEGMSDICDCFDKTSTVSTSGLV